MPTCTNVARIQSAMTDRAASPQIGVSHHILKGWALGKNIPMTMMNVGIVNNVAAEVSFINRLASRAWSSLERVNRDGGWIIFPSKGEGRERMVLIVSVGDGA